VKETERNFISDPSKFWTYVNSKKKSDGFPSHMKFKDNKASDRTEIATLFADFFETVYVTDESNVDSDDLPEIDKRVDVGNLIISQDVIAQALRNVDTSKGNGPDKISPMLLKNCSSTLSHPLFMIFNKSLSCHTFPSKWKSSYLTPIFKSGSRNDVENYRGVAILPTFGKLFESIICDLLTDEFRNCISLRQHGFMKGRSTSTNLLEFTHKTINFMEQGYQMDAIYTDIKKAFDRVNHKRLLAKLHKLGIHSSLLKWFSSYLHGRIQYVKICGHDSRSFSVTSGIPQGSHLGPILFLLFFDDVTKVIKHSSCLLYADDLKLYKKVKSVLDCSAIQRDLDAISDWCQRNFLQLSIDKCQTISFHRNMHPIHFNYEICGTFLERVTEIRDLGVILDTKMNFNSHIEYITTKAYSMLGFIKRTCYEFRDIRALKSIYCAHVRSHLDYASVVWQPYCANKKAIIESIQKKFVMYALRRTVRRDENFRLPSYESRCKTLRIDSLQRRRYNLSAFYVFDLLSNRIDAPELRSRVVIYDPVRHIRRQPFLTINHHRTNYGFHEPLNELCMIFNTFDHLYVPEMPRNTFRDQVRSSSLPDVLPYERYLDR